MDGLRLPPLIEEAGDPADESTELKSDDLPPEVQLGGAEKEEAQEKGGGEVREEVQEEEEPLSEEQELVELRAQVVQLLLELGEAREEYQRQEEGVLELRGLLEDERLASAHQAETFTRQIQRLQAQLRSVQEEMDSLQEEKESELVEAQEELRAAHEEVQELREAAEEAAAERENDIASLQEELCRMRAELQRLRSTTQEYELEVTTLRAEIAMKSQSRGQERSEGDVGVLKLECASLREESQGLKEGNRKLSERLRELQLQRDSSCNTYLAVKEERTPAAGGKDEAGGVEEMPVETDSYISVATPRASRLVDASVQKNISFEGKPVSPSSFSGGFGEILSLRDQLTQAEQRAREVQQACEGLKVELVEMQARCDSSHTERAELERELHVCREELEQLMGGKAQNLPPPSSEHLLLSIPSVGVIVIAALIWCCWAELWS